MPDLKKAIASLHDPANIKGALLASSPYVLRKALAADSTVHEIIAAGEQVLPLIAEEVRDAKSLDEITLSAFAYIVENVKPEEAPRIFGELYKKTVEKPGPFFVHFATHTMRQAFHLPQKPLEMVYTRTELIETQQRLH